MDREIPKEEIRKEARRKWVIAGAAIAAVVLVIYILSSLIRTSVDSKSIKIATAETGVLESSISANGKIIPLYEEAIVSPVATRIVEVYCNEGDSVSAGESMLCLDLHSAEAEYKRLTDEAGMRRNEMEQTALSGKTAITDLEMRIKVKEMSVDHLKAEVTNERRLDSIGSGTGDRIREAELAYSTGLLELEQLRKQLENQRRSQDVVMKSKQLESAISQRRLDEMQRTLDDARIKASRGGIVTYLNQNIGTSIGAGEKLAVVSDLSHFKISGEISEGNAAKISAGSTVLAKVGSHLMKGRVASISPQSQGGMIAFAVILDDDSDSKLRPGISASLNVVYDVKENVVLIPNGQYFQGAGEYLMFVKTSDNTLERRQVTLGDSNFDLVEVKYGISPGEEVVVSDMADFKTKKSLKLK